MSNPISSASSEFDQTIYLELDCLLDTRVGLVALHAPAAAAKLMQEAYWDRESDDFEELTGGAVTHKQFKEWWVNRDKECLKASRPTNLIHILEQLSESLVISQVNVPFVSKLRYLVNYWPYDLDQQEIEAMKQACEILTGNVIEVNMVSISPSALTPKRVKRDMSLLIMYDYYTWMENQKDTFLVTPIPEVNMIAPAISHGRVLTTEDRTVEDFGEVSPFAIGEMVMATYISIQLLPVNFFSLLRT